MSSSVSSGEGRLAAPSGGRFVNRRRAVSSEDGLYHQDTDCIIRRRLYHQETGCIIRRRAVSSGDGLYHQDTDYIHQETGCSSGSGDSRRCRRCDGPCGPARASLRRGLLSDRRFAGYSARVSDERP